MSIPRNIVELLAQFKTGSWLDFPSLTKRTRSITRLIYYLLNLSSVLKSFVLCHLKVHNCTKQTKRFIRMKRWKVGAHNTITYPYIKWTVYKTHHPLFLIFNPTPFIQHPSFITLHQSTFFWQCFESLCFETYFVWYE